MHTSGFCIAPLLKRCHERSIGFHTVMVFAGKVVRHDRSWNSGTAGMFHWCQSKRFTQHLLVCMNGASQSDRRMHVHTVIDGF